MGELLPEFWSPKGDESESPRSSKGDRVARSQIFYMAPVFWSLCTSVSLCSTPPGPRTDGIYDHHSTGESGLHGSATSMAPSTKWCELCFVTTHMEQECAQSGDPDPELKDQLKAIETAVLMMTSKKKQAAKLNQQGIKPSGEPYRKWNRVGCMYPRSCHSNLYSSCGDNHLATKCSIHSHRQARAPTTEYIHQQRNSSLLLANLTRRPKASGHGSSRTQETHSLSLPRHFSC